MFSYEFCEISKNAFITEHLKSVLNIRALKNFVKKSKQKVRLNLISFRSFS